MVLPSSRSFYSTSRNCSIAGKEISKAAWSGQGWAQPRGKHRAAKGISSWFYCLASSSGTNEPCCSVCRGTALQRIHNCPALLGVPHLIPHLQQLPKALMRLTPSISSVCRKYNSHRLVIKYPFWRRKKGSKSPDSWSNAICRVGEQKTDPEVSRCQISIALDPMYTYPLEHTLEHTKWNIGSSFPAGSTNVILGQHESPLCHRALLWDRR